MANPPSVTPSGKNKTTTLNTKPEISKTAVGNDPLRLIFYNFKCNPSFVAIASAAKIHSSGTGR